MSVHAISMSMSLLALERTCRRASGTSWRSGLGTAAVDVVGGKDLSMRNTSRWEAVAHVRRICVGADARVRRDAVPVGYGARTDLEVAHL
jgi:hypothetical protein